MEKPIDIICKHCGSRNVRRDAWAAWNASAQAWELAEVYDAAHCEDCGGRMYPADFCEAARAAIAKATGGP